VLENVQNCEKPIHLAVLV